MSDFPEKSQNCAISNIRLEALEKGMVDVKKDVSQVKDQNGIQNEILAQVKTAVEFMIEDKKEARERDKKNLEALEEITKTQIETQGVLKSLTSDVEDIKVWQKKVDERSHIDWISLLKSNIKYVIGTITVAGILWVASQVIPTLVK